MRRPSGMIAVAVLTLLASLVLALFTLLSILVYFFVGAEYATGPGTLSAIVQIMWPYAVLTLYAFSLSIALFVVASKYVYYSAIVFWALLTLFFVWWGYSLTWKNLGSLLADISRAFGYYSLLQIIASIIPLIYSIGCLLYFRTSNVKEYFRV